MIEPTQWGHVMDVAVSITILIGTGAAVTWWLTRRIENRIKDEVNHMDRLQSIDSRVTNVEANMATKKDLAEMETKMAGMATKEDLAEVKKDLAEMEAKMDDMATGMNAMKTELLDAIKNVNGNAHR